MSIDAHYMPEDPKDIADMSMPYTPQTAGGPHLELTTREHRALFELVDDTSGDEEVETEFVKVLLEALRVFKERQRKYGRANIARSGAPGVVIRLGDKLARLENLQRSEGAKDESVEDTFIDVLNYGGIGLMAYRGTWPAVAKTLHQVIDVRESDGHLRLTDDRA